MYTAKHTMLYKHKVHDGQAHVFYMDIRSGGKGYDEFVRRAIEQDGANYYRGRVSKITEDNGKLIVRGADTLSGMPITVEADLVVLASAMRPAPGIEELAQKLNVGYDEHGFLMESHPKLRPVETNTAGVYIAGACTRPRTFPNRWRRLRRRPARCRLRWRPIDLYARAGDRGRQRTDLRGLLRLRPRPVPITPSTAPKCEPGAAFSSRTRRG